MMHGYALGGYGGAGLFGPLGGLAMGFGLLLVIALIVWLVYALAKHTPTPAETAAPGGQVEPGARAQHDAALEIVRERYARGEIDDETYGRLVANLS